MLIQCSQCQTVYNFDDSALQGASVDVRCARCQTVFRVDASSAVGDDACRVEDSELAGMSFRTSATGEPATSQPSQPAPEPVFEPAPEQTFEAPATTESLLDLHPEPEPEVAEAEIEEQGNDEFSFAPLDNPPEDDGETFQPIDNDDFSNRVEDETQEDAADDASPQWAGASDEFSFSEPDDGFSFDQNEQRDQDNSFTWDDAPAAETVQEEDSPIEEPESPDFIFEPLSSTDEDDTSSAAAVEVAEPPSPYAPQEEFSLSESLAPKEDVEEHSFAPLEEPKPEIASRAPEEAPEPKRPGRSKPVEEPRKTSKFLLFILFLLLVAAGVFGYFYATLGTTDVRVMVREIQQLIMSSGTLQPQGSLTITNTESFYIDNAEEGSLFVIQGTIRNDYKEPRAELSVTATLYKGKGKAFTKKTVYCGNELSRDDLQNKPYEALAEAMSNSFGTALSNLNVAPGNSLKFTVVFNQLSDDLSEFSIEPATSKAASN